MANVVLTLSCLLSCVCTYSSLMPNRLDALFAWVLGLFHSFCASVYFLFILLAIAHRVVESLGLSDNRKALAWLTPVLSVCTYMQQGMPFAKV